MTQVSVIICTYNRCDLLRRAISSLASDTYVGTTELIVVDNNSNDRTRDIVKNCADEFSDTLRVRYEYEPEQGLSRARNRGISVAEGEIVAFLDDDAEVEPGWRTAIVDTFDQIAECDAIGGPIQPNYEVSPPDWLSEDIAGYFSILDLGDSIIEFPRSKNPIGANMAFRTSVFDHVQFPVELGRKGQSLISREEARIFGSILYRGGKLFYVPCMKVHHFIPKERLSKDWVLARAYAEGVSRVLDRQTHWSVTRLATVLLCKWLYTISKKWILRNDVDMLDQVRLSQYAGAFDHLRRRYTD